MTAMPRKLPVSGNVIIVRSDIVPHSVDVLHAVLEVVPARPPQSRSL